LNPMKRLVVLGVLSLAAVGASARSAQAWFINGCHHCGCNRCCINVCVRPYNAFSFAPYCNAFSPAGTGCVVICGYVPVNGRGAYFGNQPMGSYYGYPGYGPGGCTTGCCDYGCLPAPGTVATDSAVGETVVPGEPMPQGTPGPQLQPSSPQPIGPGAYMVPMQPAYGYAPVQPVAYNYGYQPMYNPYGYQPTYNPYGYQSTYNAYGYQPMPMNYYPVQPPSYWYGR
jgi:hypothetical protein